MIPGLCYLGAQPQCDNVCAPALAKSAVEPLCLCDCSAQMTAGCPGHTFLEQGGVIKSSQSPWVLRSIFSGHRNKSLLPPAGNSLPAQAPCTCMCSRDLHVAKAVSPPCVTVQGKPAGKHWLWLSPGWFQLLQR